MWSKAGETCGLFAREGSKLWQEGDEAACCDGSDAGDGLEPGNAGSESRRLLQEALEGVFKPDQLAGEEVDLLGEEALQAVIARGAEAVLDGGAFGDEDLAVPDKGRKGLASLIRRGPGFEAW